MYNSILARSFTKHEQKKFRYGAFFACLLIALSFCTVFKPYLGPLPVLSLRVSMGVGLKMLMVKDSSTSQKIAYKHNSLHNDQFEDVIINSSVPLHIVNSSHHQNTSTSINLIIFHNTTNNISQQQIVKEVEDFIQKKIEPVAICKTTTRSDFCEIKDEIRIQGSSGTVFIPQRGAGAGAGAENNMSWVIKPYARKGDQAAMNSVKEWRVIMGSRLRSPQCTQNHSVPAVLFSTGGYAGNHFHDFTDIVIPLYLTSRQFNGQVRFLVTNKDSWWIKKYNNLLNKLSRYDIIDIDNSNDHIHCFIGGVVGLKRYDNKELNIDPSKSFYSMEDFRLFLRSSYSLKKATASKQNPQLLIVSRKRSRAFTNTGKIVQMARTLGFKVVVAEADANVSRFAEIVNSCDVLLGVHGAGLTNIVFLPENAVFIQVVPFGGVDWLARTDFEVPSKDMNLRYLEYKIKVEESSLIQQYPLDHQVIRDPSSIEKRGWNDFRSVYLDKQNVQLDLNRFRGTLLKALEFLRQ